MFCAYETRKRCSFRDEKGKYADNMSVRCVKRGLRSSILRDIRSGQNIRAAVIDVGLLSRYPCVYLCR